MNWTPLLIIAAVVAVVLMLKKSGQISAQAALAHLKNGALVIDVRSRGEFGSGHLSRAINIPLDEIESAIPKRVKDKDQALLLHCASGMRSGVARGKLKSMGYTNAFNLGSHGRAEKIVRAAGGN
jgi:phage shock protein E